MTSAPVLVNVHATSRLKPLITDGAPGSVTPYTSSESGTERCAAYQIDGSERSRCGSPARSANLSRVREGDTAQLLLPTLTSPEPSCAAPAAARIAPPNASASAPAAVSGAPGGGSGVESMRGAVCPLGTMGSWIEARAENSASAARSPTK